MNLTTFQTQQGSQIVIAGDSGNPVPLRLDSIVNHLAGPSAEHWPSGSESFSLYFIGPASPILPQGTYPVPWGDLGVPELFLVPIGRVPAGIRYEAVFSRIPAAVVQGS